MITTPMNASTTCVKPHLENQFLDSDSRWAAVQERNVEAVDRFVYAVRTTGIFCRPTCPSRRPKRENVEFYAGGAEATHAGFRPCRRCKPDGEPHEARWSNLIAKACAMLRDAPQAPTLAGLADALGLSPYHLHRQFKKRVGVTPHEYASTCRVQRLQQGLESGAGVTDAIYDAGFGSSSRVYEKAADTLGMTPSRFRAGGDGLEVHFTVTRCALGWLLVAATDVGVCTIELDDDREVLKLRLQKRFPNAELEEAGTDLHAWVKQIVAYLEAPEQGLSLPLDVRGTAFQRRVWKALQDIPVGDTASYADVAERIGQPTAARAVARACAGNALALAIPCHRVIRRGGELGGYRWGIERKAWLLSRERGE